MIKISWLSGWNKRQKIVLTGDISGAQTNYQIKLTIPYDSDMQVDFDDLRFTKSDGITLIDAWLESKVNSTSVIVWVEFPTTPANGVTEDYYMYYGNSNVVSAWSGINTFIQYHGAATSTFLDPLVVSPTNVAYEGRIKRIGSSDLMWGLSINSVWFTEMLGVYAAGANDRYLHTFNNWVGSDVSEQPGLPDDTWVRAKITCDGTVVHGYIDDNEISTGITTNIPNENLGLGFWEISGSGEQAWSFARKFVANSPTYLLKNLCWEILINDVIQSDFEIIKVLDTIAGSKKFDVIFSGSEKDQIFNHYEDVKIYKDGIPIFRGRIEEIIPNHTNDTTTISGRDYIAELMDKYVIEAYDTKLRSYIIDDLIEKHSIHIGRSHIISSPSGSKITHTFKSSVWDVLVECAFDDNYKFLVDVNNDLYYTPSGWTDSGMSLELGVSDIYSFNIEETSKDIINSVTIIGGGSPQIIITQDDLASQLYYGIIKTKQIFDNSVDTIDLASIKADNYLAENAWVLDMIIFEVDGYETLNAGELITVTLSGHNIDGTYLVIDKQHEYPSGVTSIRVARYDKNLETIITNLVDRLNNLEQQTTITARIQKNYEQQGMSDTLKIYSRTIGSSFKLGVTGHCELGKNLRDNTGVAVLEYSGS